MPIVNRRQPPCAYSVLAACIHDLNLRFSGSMASVWIALLTTSCGYVSAQYAVPPMPPATSVCAHRA